MVRARMRRLAAAALLALPALLAFGRGGYFAGHARPGGDPRVPAARGRGRGRGPAAPAVDAAAASRSAGSAALTAWTGLSLLWAPLAGPAFADLERLVLYTAALAAGIALLRTPWVEPALLATTVAARRLRALGAARAVAGRPPGAPRRR